MFKIIQIGIPTVKSVCFVLCLNLYIPIYTPKEPKKKKDKIKKDFSGILHLFFLAFCLSTYTKTNPIIFITNKYIIKYIIKSPKRLYKNYI